MVAIVLAVFGLALVDGDVVVIANRTDAPMTCTVVAAEQVWPLVIPPGGERSVVVHHRVETSVRLDGSSGCADYYLPRDEAVFVAYAPSGRRCKARVVRVPVLLGGGAIVRILRALPVARP